MFNAVVLTLGEHCVNIAELTVCDTTDELTTVPSVNAILQ